MGGVSEVLQEQKAAGAHNAQRHGKVVEPGQAQERMITGHVVEVETVQETLEEFALLSLALLAKSGWSHALQSGVIGENGG